MALFSRDTRPRAEAVQLHSHRSMTGNERYRLSVEMSDSARDIALDRLCRKYPHLSPQEIMAIYMELIMGWKPPEASRGKRPA